MATKALNGIKPALSPNGSVDASEEMLALNDRQQRFVLEYLVDMKAADAADRAGYTGNRATMLVTGSQLLVNPKIGHAIAVCQTQLAENLHITHDDVVKGLLEVARDPEQMGGARAESWKHIAKMLGYYVERSESVNVTRHVYSRLNKYTDDQLDAIVEAAPGPRALPPGTPIGGGPGTGKGTKALSEPQP